MTLTVKWNLGDWPCNNYPKHKLQIFDETMTAAAATMLSDSMTQMNDLQAEQKDVQTDQDADRHRTPAISPRL